MNEQILKNGLIQGNTEAYEHLYGLYYKKLVVYCFNLTNDWAKAEDIVQNVMLKLWKDRKTITIKSSVKHYLFTSVYNSFVTEYKKEKRFEESLQLIREETLETLFNIEDEEIDAKIRLLNSAIEELPKKCKTVFLLHKRSGLKHKEIAHELSLSEKNVEKHISRALKRIRAYFYKHRTLLIFIFYFILR